MATILIVEDEIIIRKDIKQTLKGLGYSVVGEATEGEQAIRLAHELHPDLVMMDIALKGEMSGVEAATTIQQQEHVPVVFLTGHSDQAARTEAERAHPYGYLLKPFRAMDIMNVVELALLKRKAERPGNALVNS